MELIKQILKLRDAGFSIKAMGRHTGLSRNTIRKYLQRFKGQPLKDISPGELSVLAYNGDTTDYKGERFSRLTDHLRYAETQLSRTGVTRQLLWTEYKQGQPEGYNYSQYCYHFNEFLRHKEVVMHIDHKAAETIMIDFAGKRPCYIDLQTGEQIRCQLFVSVLPHSGLIYCKAVDSQNTYDFTGCINTMLKFYGGTPKTILCDNLRTAVTRPSRYEPVFTEACDQLSDHYGTVFTATRPYKPRDKAMVEKSVNIIYNHVLGPLRNHLFYSLQALNEAILQALEALNRRPYKGSAYSRRQLFEQHEQHLLGSLPAEPFTPKKTIQATVQRNYHVQLSEDHHYYSVPYQYAGKKVKVLYDGDTVEIYHEHNRIALHNRTDRHKAYHTQPGHMPSNHQHTLEVKGWTREDMLQKALLIGECTYRAVEYILSSSIYPEQNFKSCYGMLMLQKQYGTTRLEAACKRATGGTRVNYTMIKNILQKGLDAQGEIFNAPPLPRHDNIRGAGHYK
ncbi:MAG: IS21 family transposase [Chitinophagales bacterium]